MNASEPDIGPITAVVFVRLERDDSGLQLACFVTDDGASFMLDAGGLELRIRALQTAGREVGEERRALRLLAAG